LVGFIIFQAMPETLIKIFTKEAETIAIGRNAFRIISVAFLPAAFGIILTISFQSISHGRSALMMSILRQVVLLIPSAYLLGKFLGLGYIWLAFPISELIVAAVFYPVFQRTIKAAFASKLAAQQISVIQE
jgi:Na+-driven multidrug efflux pump